MLLGLVLCGAALCTLKRNRIQDGIFLFVSFIVLGTLSAIRYDIGFDYSYVYAPIYYRMLNDTTGELLARIGWEPGFRLLLRVLMLVSDNFQTIFVVTSLLTIFLIMLYFWLFSPNPLISVFLFVTLSHYYCSMNFVRQTLAAAIAMFTLPLMKAFLKKIRNEDVVGSLPFAGGYLAVVLLASSFHMSTLILIPFFFVNLIPVNKYVLAAYTVITAIIFYNTHNIIEFVTRYWYQQYALYSIHMQVGFTPQFAIAALIVFIILFACSERLVSRDKENRLYVNYAFFTFFFILMGMRHSVLDRLSLPFVLLAPVGIAIVVTSLGRRLRAEAPGISRNMAIYATLLFTIFGGGLAIHHYALTMDHHGVVPYQVVFNQPFYQDYVQRLRGDQVGLPVWDAPEFEPEFIELDEELFFNEPHHPEVGLTDDDDLTEVTLDDFIDLIDGELRE